MYHSITIGDKNTYDDWHLVAEERPSVQPPTANTSFVDIPGMNGSLDISEALTGYPTYGRRKGSWEFTILNDYESWISLYQRMSNYLHNRKLKAILEDDPAYYYEGRFYISKWKSDHPNSKITVEYEVQPYKKEHAAVDDPWLWDPFSFETGIITTYIFSDIKVESDTAWTTKTITQAIFGDEPVCPTFKVTSDSGNGMTVRFVSSDLNVDVTEILKDGDNYIPEIIFVGGEISISFKGKGKVSISYHKGML